MLAVLFPGQGSQVVGMGRDAFDASPAAREVFEAADAALGFDLTKICFEGPEDVLRQTENLQPAILTTSVALFRALEEKQALAPTFLAGHSLGEYSALVVSGSLSFHDAVRLVKARGSFMQEAVPFGKGAMAAVLGVTPEILGDVCQRVSAELGQVVSPANFNSPQQTVIAGDTEAVERACVLAREQGAKRTVNLPVSAPFHCSLMAPAAEKLAPELAGVSFQDANPPVLSNVEALPNHQGARMAELLKKQVTAPVRFTETIEQLVSLGVDRVLEVGPGQVLTGLVARIARRMRRGNFGCMGDLEEACSLVSNS